MTLAEQVKTCKTPAEAILLLANAIDELRQPADPWDVSLWDDDPAYQAELSAMQIEQTGEEETTVTLAAPDDEKRGARAMFAQEILNLDEALPDVERPCEVYAKAGPLWLWLGNRELLMQYPEHVRAAMVRDVMEDDPKTAEEFGRDILKDPGAESADAYTSRRGM